MAQQINLVLKDELEKVVEEIAGLRK